MDYRLYLVRVFSTRWEEALAFYRDTLQWPLSYNSSPGAGYSPTSGMWTAIF